MSAPEKYPVENLVWNQRIMIVADRLLAAVMLACLCVPLVMVINRIVIGWYGWYVIPVVFLVSIESMISHYRMRGISIASEEWWLYRIAELVVVIVLLKLLLYGIHGISQILTDFSLWRQNLFSFFSEPEYLLLILFVIAIWVISGELDHEFFQIEGDEKLLRAEFDVGFSEQRVEVRQRLANTIITGGGLMIVLVAFISLGNSSAWMNSGPVRQGVIAILIYFLCGLTLLSLTQFSILRVRWVIDHVQIERKVTTRWFGYSLLMIFSLAVIAFLLPTGYSAQFLEILQTAIAYVFLVLQLIIYFLTLPFILFFSWLMSLFNRPVKQPALPRMVIQPPPQLTSGEPIQWWEFLKTLLFWAVLIGLIGYAFYYYFREHPEYFSWMRRSRFFNNFFRFWEAFRTWIGGFNKKIVDTVNNRMKLIRRRTAVRIGDVKWRFMNPNRLDPRQQVRFYYLALVRRGSQSGLPRVESQTPQEYSERLKNHLVEMVDILDKDSTDVPEDIYSLTQGFNEARYSQHAISGNQASLARRTWERVSRVFRVLKDQID